MSRTYCKVLAIAMLIGGILGFATPHLLGFHRHNSETRLDSSQAIDQQLMVRGRLKATMSAPGGQAFAGSITLADSTRLIRTAK